MKPVRRLMAGLALAVTLVAPAVAQTGLAMRDRLVVISSGSATAVTQILASGFTERYEGVTAPLVRLLPSSAALELFCAGLGAQTPDIAIVVRRMARSTLDTCQANGVRDVVELQLGLGAVVLAVRRGEPTPNLTTRQVWEALAAERVTAEEFVPNRTANWSDLAPALPQTPIRLLMPPRGNGTTGLFEDMVLEGGCRDVKAVRLLFEASYRRGKCITLRDDGRVRLMEGVEIPAALLASPPGTVGLVSYDQLLASGGNLVALALDGVLPTQASIFAQDYVATRTVYLYAKRQHTRLRDGIGVVRGIREFLNEAMAESTTGPGGALSVTGLVPLGPAERTAQRRIADNLTAMSR
ncbi:PstS family phosphate ABC transporter substrate-binding protein [Falsiroseomonas sp. E2-1-a20]|uniref:PstS family phosphate ABC transporter substrate-binding protein n=1 Tax=Falsiroseomonas sp. E2-1-a20 TaxID=3239300 RepID=UPI003F3D2F8B